MVSPTSPVRTPLLPAVTALWRREVVKFLRDRSRVVGAVAQPLGVWLLLGLGFQGTFVLPGAAGAGPSYAEFLLPGVVVMVLLFTAIFSTISVVDERREGFLQAALVSPSPRIALVLGNVLGGTTLAVVQAVPFVALAPVVGLSPTLPGLAIVLAGAVPTALAFTALGYTIAWRVETTRGFHAIMNLFLLPIWFLSGAVFPAAGAPPALAWIMRANPALYGVEAIRHGLYHPAAAPAATVAPAAAVAVMWAVALAMCALAAVIVRRHGRR